MCGEGCQQWVHIELSHFYVNRGLVNKLLNHEQYYNNVFQNTVFGYSYHGKSKLNKLYYDLLPYVNSAVLMCSLLFIL